MKITAASILILSIVCLSACVDLAKPPEVAKCAGNNPLGCSDNSRADSGVTRKDGSATGEDAPATVLDSVSSPIDTTLPQDAGTKDTPPSIPDIAQDEATIKLDTQTPVEPSPVEPRTEPTVEPIVVVEPSTTDAAPAIDTRISLDSTPVNCLEAIKVNGYAFPPANPCSACKENSVSRETICVAMIDCLAAKYPCTGNCWSDCRNKAGANSISELCATDLKNAACGSH